MQRVYRRIAAGQRAGSRHDTLAEELATEGAGRLLLGVLPDEDVFVALLAMLNWPLQAIGNIDAVRAWREANGIPVLSFENILGMILSPLAWAMGIQWKDCGFFGSMMGTQVIATEFVAYARLGEAINAGSVAHRTSEIATYALCGFANFGSIAIQLGGIGEMRSEELV